MKPIIAPSVLSSDFANLQSECTEVLENGADWIHLDIMDSKFVPNLTFGPPVVSAIRKHFPNAFLDCHLMVTDPSLLIKDLTNEKTKADMITIHIEPFLTLHNDDFDTAMKECAQVLSNIRAGNAKVGLALSPDTNIALVMAGLERYPNYVDMVLVMTVRPGFGGQSFMREMLPKVKTVRERYPDLLIQVDGGIDKTTIKSAREAGANVFVAGSAIFGKEDRSQAIYELLLEIS